MTEKILWASTDIKIKVEGCEFDTSDETNTECSEGDVFYKIYETTNVIQAMRDYLDLLDKDWQVHELVVSTFAKDGIRVMLRIDSDLDLFGIIDTFASLPGSISEVVSMSDEEYDQYQHVHGTQCS